MAEVMEGRAAPAQIAGLLIGLAMKGERPAEIVGLARTMRAHAVPVSRRYDDVFDTCGTGGDRAGHLQHLVVRGAGRRRLRRARREARQPIGVEPVGQRRRVRGARRPRHRRRRPSSSAVWPRPASGSSSRRRSIRRCATPAPARRELGVRTAFNLLGPLTNPAGATRQLVGVPRPGVHRADGAGADAARHRSARGSCTAPTASTRSRRPATRRSRNAATARSTRSICIRPTSGCRRRRPASLQGGDAHENARIIEGVLAGARGPARDVVLLNAGAALFIAGAAASVERRHRCRRRARSIAATRKRTLERLVSHLDRRRVRGRSDGMTGPSRRGRTADLLATIVAATRRIVEVRAGSASRSAALARAGGSANAARRAGFGRRCRGRIASTSSPSASGGRRRAACCARATIRWRSPAATRPPARRRSRC